MRAQLIRSFGSTDVFELTDVPDPVAGPGDVLVRIEAASVNPVDTKVRKSGRAVAADLPSILGCDFAGTVVAVGSGVDRFRAGDAVYGCAGGVKGVSGGTYAELMAADARLVAHRPATLSTREAAALPLVTITAWEALDRSQLSAGQTILVHGGTGGVGHIAVQLAKSRGARVVTTVSSEEKAALARSLGADETIDYRNESVDAYVERLTSGHGFDVVFDATGGSDIATSFAGARLNGHVVTIVSGYDADLRPMQAKGLSLHVVFMLIPMLYDIGRERHGAVLEEAAALVAAGHLRPLLDPRLFSLAEVPDAHTYLEAGLATGKIVIDVA